MTCPGAYSEWRIDEFREVFFDTCCPHQETPQVQFYFYRTRFRTRLGGENERRFYGNISCCYVVRGITRDIKSADEIQKKKMKDKTARDLYRYHRLKQLRRLHTRRRQRRRQRRRAIVNAIKYTHDFSRFSQLPLVARFSAYILLRDEILPPKQFCSFLFSPPLSTFL